MTFPFGVAVSSPAPVLNHKELTIPTNTTTTTTTTKGKTMPTTGVVTKNFFYQKQQQEQEHNQEPSSISPNRPSSPTISSSSTICNSNNCSRLTKPTTKVRLALSQFISDTSPKKNKDKMKFISGNGSTDAIIVVDLTKETGSTSCIIPTTTNINENDTKKNPRLLWKQKSTTSVGSTAANSSVCTSFCDDDDYEPDEEEETTAIRVSPTMDVDDDNKYGNQNKPRIHFSEINHNSNDDDDQESNILTARKKMYMTPLGSTQPLLKQQQEQHPQPPPILNQENNHSPVNPASPIKRRRAKSWKPVSPSGVTGLDPKSTSITGKEHFLQATNFPSATRISPMTTDEPNKTVVKCKYVNGKRVAYADDDCLIPSWKSNNSDNNSNGNVRAASNFTASMNKSMGCIGLNHLEETTTSPILKIGTDKTINPNPWTTASKTAVGNSCSSPLNKRRAKSWKPVSPTKNEFNVNTTASTNRYVNGKRIQSELSSSLTGISNYNNDKTSINIIADPIIETTRTPPTPTGKGSLIASKLAWLEKTEVPLSSSPQPLPSSSVVTTTTPGTIPSIYKSKNLRYSGSNSSLTTFEKEKGNGSGHDNQQKNNRNSEFCSSFECSISELDFDLNTASPVGTLQSQSFGKDGSSKSYPSVGNLNLDKSHNLLDLMSPTKQQPSPTKNGKYDRRYPSIPKPPATMEDSMSMIQMERNIQRKEQQHQHQTSNRSNNNTISNDKFRNFRSTGRTVTGGGELQDSIALIQFAPPSRYYTTNQRSNSMEDTISENDEDATEVETVNNDDDDCIVPIESSSMLQQVSEDDTFMTNITHEMADPTRPTSIHKNLWNNTRRRSLELLYSGGEDDSNSNKNENDEGDNDNDEDVMSATSSTSSCCSSGRKKILSSNPAFQVFQSRNKPTDISVHSPMCTTKRTFGRPTPTSLLNNAYTNNNNSNNNSNNNLSSIQRFEDFSKKNDKKEFHPSYKDEEYTREKHDVATTPDKIRQRLITKCSIPSPTSLNNGNQKNNNIKQQRENNISNPYETTTLPANKLNTIKLVDHDPKRDESSRRLVSRTPTGMQNVLIPTQAVTTSTISARHSSSGSTKGTCSSNVQAHKKTPIWMLDREAKLHKKVNLKRAGQLKLTITDEAPTVHNVPHLNDYKDDDITLIWWSKEEYVTFKFEYEAVLYLIEENKPIDENQYCARGLEKKTQNGAWELYEYHRDSVNAVLDVQDKYRKTNSTQPVGEMEAAYQIISSKAMKEAIERGKQDAKAVKKFMRDWLQKTSKKEKTSDTTKGQQKEVNSSLTVPISKGKDETMKQCNMVLKSVRFAEAEVVHPVPRLVDITRDVHESIWFTPSDMALMEKEIRRALKLYESCGCIENGDEHLPTGVSARGLECRTKEEKKKLGIRQRTVWDVVLNIQNQSRQLNQPIDVDKIARSVNEESAKAVKKALKRAKKDHKETKK